MLLQFQAYIYLGAVQEGNTQHTDTREVIAMLHVPGPVYLQSPKRFSQQKEKTHEVFQQRKAGQVDKATRRT